MKLKRHGHESNKMLSQALPVSNPMPAKIVPAQSQHGGNSHIQSERGARVAFYNTGFDKKKFWAAQNPGKGTLRSAHELMQVARQMIKGEKK